MTKQLNLGAMSETNSPDQLLPDGTRAKQTEMPFAVIQGQPLLQLPDDLYIPPDALEVFLDAFEGPLDLLLYLTRRQNLDIVNIPIAEVTRQYTGYIEMMTTLRMELAAEYLVMAAILAEIKSRMLLPRIETEEDEEDPRADLIRRLQEYEQFKQAADDLDLLPRLERDLVVASAAYEKPKTQQKPPEVDLREVLLALRDVMARADLVAQHHIQSEPLSVRERMSRIAELVSQTDQFVEFKQCFDLSEGRLGAVVTFLALLELLREHLVDLVQQEQFGVIYLRRPSETQA